MILLALLAAAAPSPALVQRSDEANLAFVSCLFAASREANAAQVSVATFQRRLAKACLAEERVLRARTTNLLAQRGEANPSAAAERMIFEARRSVVSTYQSLQQLQPQLEQLAEICRRQPRACQ